MNTTIDVTAVTRPQPGGGKIVEFQPIPDVPAKRGLLTITSEILSSAILPADDLEKMVIKPRDNLCGTWFRQGDLGFIFGERGLGKTWLALDIARGLAEGRNVGPWRVPGTRRVLYVDGEMPLDSIRDRNRALRLNDGALGVLNHEWLFEKTGHVLNLSDATVQDAILTLCEEEGHEILILDNLSCLFTGIAENDADAWECVLPWLLNLRRRKIAVIIVHHANRARLHMRGTSRREDAAFWILRLDALPDHAKSSNGAHFITRFTKARQGTREEIEPLEWHYESENDRVRVTFRQLQTVEVFKQWVRDGLESCSDIAEEMGLSKGAVSKMAKRGERDGWLKIDGRNYRILDSP
jgi:KaiC/GvpD/RAD55 family RecA-like ATPase